MRTVLYAEDYASFAEPSRKRFLKSFHASDQYFDLLILCRLQWTQNSNYSDFEFWLHKYQNTFNKMLVSDGDILILIGLHPLLAISTPWTVILHKSYYYSPWYYWKLYFSDFYILSVFYFEILILWMNIHSLQSAICNHMTNSFSDVICWQLLWTSFGNPEEKVIS
jgi:hypothetical protein